MDPDVSAYASSDGKQIYLMAWHYHDNDVEGDAANITFNLENLPVTSGKAKVRFFLIDKENSNSYEAWLKMGSPQSPDSAEYKRLEDASSLKEILMKDNIRINKHKAKYEFTLQRQGVVLFILDLPVKKNKHSE